MSKAPRYLVSFGRRRGRPLRKSKQILFDTLLPKLRIELPESGQLNPATLFDQPKAVWLEIGFGGGEHLAHQAKFNPDIGFIGCEPYVNGISGLLTAIDEQGLKNIRIYDGDARLLMDALPDDAIERAFILYPDPWPKIRHHNRRLVSTPTLDILSRVLKSGSQLRLATDDSDYCTWMLEHLIPHKDFDWQAQESKDWLTPPQDWISTRYEQKAKAAGRIPSYLNFLRN